MVRAAFFFFLLFFSVTALQAQHPSRIRGKVTDKGAGLPYAEVTLYQGMETVSAIKADICGEFNFGVVSPGNYDVVAQIGSVSVLQNITLDSNSTYILNMYDGPPCPCCPTKQYVANPSWHGPVERGDLSLPQTF